METALATEVRRKREPARLEETGLARTAMLYPALFAVRLSLYPCERASIFGAENPCRGRYETRQETHRS